MHDASHINVKPLLVAAAAAATATAMAAWNGRRIGRGVTSEYLARFPVDAAGVANGAQGYVLPGTNGRGLLLLHGSGDSPHSMRYLATALNAAGYEVHVPLLPGHGRSPAAFANATASEYRAAVMSALADVVRRNSWTGVIGLSMGGALAATAASESAGVNALVLLAPYVVPTDQVRVTNRWSAFWSPLMPYVRGRGESSVHDPIAREESRAYGTFSRGALAALVATADAGYRALGAIRVPTLVINSTQDNRIPRELATRALNAITAPLEQHWLEGCGHIITVDYCKDTVAQLVLTFLARHAG